MSLVVTVAAAIRPVSASTAMCNLRHDRRVFVPCFASSYSPDPQSFSPVLSTSRCIGPEPGRGPTTARFSARRLNVV